MVRACCGLLIAVALSGLSASPAIADKFSSIFVLGVSLNDRDDDALAQSLAAHLIHTGKTVVSNRHLTHEEKRASAQEALEALAAREQSQLLLSASVTLNKHDNDPRRDDYYVTISLYDAVRHRALPVIKDLCQTDDLSLCVSELADKSITRAQDKSNLSERDPPSYSAGAMAEVPNTVKNLESAIAKGQTDGAAKGTVSTQHPLSQRRKVIMGIAGGLAVLTLGVAIGLTAIDGTPNNNGLCSYQNGPPVSRCIWDTRAGYAVAYAGTAVLAGGVVLTWLLPDGAKK